MKVRQIIPPSLHPLSKPFWAQFKYQRLHDYFVYPSQDSVFILDKQLMVHQTLRLADYSKLHPHHVSSIAWHKHHGMLAIAVTTEILLFRCTEQNAVPQWQFAAKLAVPEAKNSTDAHVLLNWRGVTARDTCLLVSHATKLHLLELSALFESRVATTHPTEISDHVPIWSGPLPRESQSGMACSPCGRYLAVSAAHHCCVKLWYRASNTRTGLSFIYLPHSRAVIDMQWRDTPRGRAVLLTLSADGCVNLWTESPFSERVNFTLSLVIDEGEGYGVTKHYSATTTFGGIIGVSWLSDPVHEEQQDSKEDSSESRANSHALKQTGHAMTRNIQERHGNTVSVTSGGSQDWLLGVQKDGGVLVWKVKGLNEHPLQAPVIALLSCIKGVLPAQQDWLHLAVSAQLFVFPSEPHSYAPSLFNLYALAPHARSIAGWHISQSSSRISSVVNRLHGHHAPVTQLSTHPRLPLAASLDEHHRLVVWRVHDQHVIDAPLACSHLTAFEHCTAFTWDLNEPVLYTVISNEGLFMNEITLPAEEHTVASVTPVTQLTRVSASTDWSQLLCMPAVSYSALVPHVTPRSIHLAALSKTGDIIKVYRVTRASDVKVQLLCEHESDDELYTHLAAPRHVFSAGTPCTLFTASERGVVRGWMVLHEDEDEESIALHPVLEFQAHSAPLTQLRVNYLGRVATMTRDELKIWELESSVPQYRHESLIDAQLAHHTSTGPQSALSIGAALSPLISVSQHSATTVQHTAPLDMDWHTTPEGHVLLATHARCSATVRAGLQQDAARRLHPRVDSVAQRGIECCRAQGCGVECQWCAVECARATAERGVQVE